MSSRVWRPLRVRHVTSQAARTVPWSLRAGAPGRAIVRVHQRGVIEGGRGGSLNQDSAGYAGDDGREGRGELKARGRDPRCYHRPAHDRPTALLPDDRHRVSEQRPGLHTLYEVIGADVIARWHRMVGDDTRFLTGTDEHSVNIHQRAQELGQDTRAFVDGWSSCSGDAEDALLIAPDGSSGPRTRITRRASQEMVRRAFANGDVYQGKYEGWYCPNEGFRKHQRPARDATGMQLPEPPERAPPVADERNWFFRLSAYAEPLLATTRRTRSGCSPSTGATRCSPSSATGSRTSRSAARPSRWGIPFPIRGGRHDAAARGRLAGPGGGRHLRLVRRADQLHHRRRLPGRPGRVRASGGRPTCTSSARTSTASTRSSGRRC